jgi:hypothetical protein
MRSLVFRTLTPCRLVGRYQRFGGTYCLHLQGWRIFFYETMVSVHESTWGHDPEEQNRHFRRRENLKFYSGVRCVIYGNKKEHSLQSVYKPQVACDSNLNLFLLLNNL